MRWNRTRRGATARWLIVGVLACAAPVRRPDAQTVPARLSDSAFWALVTDFSESNGYFRSDNFVSNETTYQWVIPDLLRTTSRGGVYLGVGPDQNFTYLVALKPKIAFVFDIRRQNMLTHLMYKALIEQSSDRADFLSRLFARPRPPGLDTSTSAGALFGAYQAVAPDSALAKRTLAGIVDRLRRVHGFALADSDTATIAYVYQTFVMFGPDITYNSSQARRMFGRGRMPSYAELQIETDSAGAQRSYMATEGNFRVLKDLESNNLIVPLVGDFAGPKAIRAVASYLKEHHQVVTAFYLSNVEQYLFQDDEEWRRFYQNVGTLPLDSSSTFIRSVFGGMGYYGGGGGFAAYMRARQMLASMLEQVRLFSDGKLISYDDVIRSSR